MAITDTSNPAIGSIAIRVTFGGSTVQFDRFLSYEYSEDYLSPSDHGSFDLDEKELSPQDLAVLIPGAKVEIVVDGHLQSTGILDDVASDVDRSGGSIVHLIFRDRMSQAVDGQVDPKVRFIPSMTLADVMVAIFQPFGFTAFEIDNAANRNIITGRIYGTPTSNKGKPLKSYLLHQEKPYPNEGAFAFASRVSQRFGLWIRPKADGTTLVVSKPDFDQEPRYGLQLAYGTDSISNNIERGHFRKSRQEQPSILYASGFGGGGNFAKSRLRSGIINPVVNADNSATLAAYPNVKFVSVPAVTKAFPPFVEGASRPAFLYDPESHDQSQLDAFLLRELSLRMRKALTARYEFMGHALNGQTVAVDTIVNVNDQRPTVRWQGPLWVLARRFSKSASAGTRTAIEGILPGSMVF